MQLNLWKINEDFYVDLTKQLGKGAFGNVYLGFQKSQARIIAVKHIPEQKCVIFNYERELEMMEKVRKINQANIMGYYGYDKNEAGLLIYLELCAGGSIASKIEKETKISEINVLKLFKELVQAMAFINQDNIVHRDLKPDNLLLDEDGNLKISDFGLARSLGVLMTQVGTPMYIAPEVYISKMYDLKCDVWSAGLILFQMLTGKYMFPNVKTMEDLLKQISKLSNPDFVIPYPAGLHKMWSVITRQMLTYDYKKRPSFSDILASLNKVYGQMEKEISKKYGYEMEEMNEGIHVTNMVKPTQARKEAKKQVNADEGFSIQNSFNNLNDFRKYINYFSMKYKVITKIKNYVTEKTLNYDNLLIYSFAFLINACYLNKVIAIKDQLKSKKILLPDRTVQIQDFQHYHLQQFQELNSEFIKKFKKEEASVISVLEDMFMQFQKYSTRNDKKEVIEKYCQQIYRMVKHLKEKNVAEFQIYLAEYNKLLKSPGIQKKEAQMSNDSTLKSLFFMGVIGNVEEVFEDKNYQANDYMTMRRQQLENMGRQEMIAMLRKWNIFQK